MNARHLQWIAASLFALGTLAANRPAAGDEAGSCSVRSLHGTYSYSGQGFLLFPSPSTPPEAPSSVPAYAPFALAGSFTFFGNGKLTGADVINLGFGGINRANSGTYVVDDFENCTFTVTFTSVADVSFPLPVHLHVALSESGETAQFVNTDAGFILGIPGVRQ
jgi:hypothetical protein